MSSSSMTDEDRRSVALEYLKAFDNAGVTASGGSILDLFGGRCAGLFPKMGRRHGEGSDRSDVRRRRGHPEIDPP